MGLLEQWDEHNQATTERLNRQTKPVVSRSAALGMKLYALVMAACLLVVLVAAIAYR